MASAVVVCTLAIGEEMVLKSKRTSAGLVEIRDASTAGWYALYVNGNLVEQSADLNYIQREFDKY